MNSFCKVIIKLLFLKIQIFFILGMLNEANLNGSKNIDMCYERSIII